MNEFAFLAVVHRAHQPDVDLLDLALRLATPLRFLQSVALFWLPLTSIASFWSQFQQGLSAAERVFALIDAEPRVIQRDAAPVGRLAGRVEFARDPA